METAQVLSQWAILGGEVSNISALLSISLIADVTLSTGFNLLRVAFRASAFIAVISLSSTELLTNTAVVLRHATTMGLQLS